MSDHQNGNGNPNPGTPARYVPPPPMTFAPVQADYEVVAEPERIQVGDYVRAIRRHLGVVAGALVAALAMAVVIIVNQDPEYRSTAMMEAKGGAGGAGGALGGLAGLGSALGGGNNMLTQVEILKSRRMAGFVVDSVGMRLQKTEKSADFPSGLLENVQVTRGPDADWEYIRLAFAADGVTAKSSEGPQASARYGAPIHLPGVRFTVSERPPVEKAELVVLTRDQAIGMFLHKFFATQRERTSIVDLGYTADDPRVSQRVVNAAAAIFQEKSVEKADRESQHRLEFLREQMAYTDSVLMDAQAKLSAFQQQQKAYSATARFQERQAQIATRETERLQAQAELRMYKLLLGRLQQSEPGNVARNIETVVSSPAVSGNAVISPLFSRLEAYQTTRDTLIAGGRSEINPEVQRVDRLIGTTQASLVGAVSSHVAAMEAQLRSLSELEGEIVQSLEGLPAADAEEVRLTQEVEGLGKMSLFLREEYSKLRLSEMVEDGKLEIVDEALPGWSVNTPRWQIFFSSIVLGLLFGGGGAILLDRSNTSIRRRDEVERVLQVTPLAVIPRVAAGGGRRLPQISSFRKGGTSVATIAARDLIANTHANSVGAEAYRTLRTNLLFSQAMGGALRTIVVTSPSMNEGRTTVASNLAVTFAQQGMRVLLVDCDLRRPRLHTLFGLQREPGLTHYVLGQGSMEDVVQPTAVEGLWVLPSGVLPPMNPSDLLGGSLMRGALDRLSASYDLLILDTPPLLASTAGTAVLGAQADGVLLVLRAGHTARDDAQHALQQLSAVGARVVGAVLNDPDAKVPEYAEYEGAEA